MWAISGGSSPLTRGKHITGLARAARGRLIPAHAGKTAVTEAKPPVVEAHPRSRGENPVTLKTIGKLYGSSPLTRGKLIDEICGTLDARLIPAHAGKTARCAS